MRSFIALVLAISFFSTQTVFAADTYDVVVYGGTAGGIVSAIAAKQEGASVVVVEPTKHLGGMVTGGLGATDKGIDTTIGGMSLQFYQRVYDWYERPEAWTVETRESYLQKHPKTIDASRRAWWYPEPSVAGRVLRQMIDEAKVPVFTEQRLTAVDVEVGESGQHIHSIHCAGGREFVGRVFIDATYEGDLLAAAGVEYHVGREGRDAYGEPLAGVVPVEWSTRKQWPVDIRPYDDAGKLLFGVQDCPRGEDGQGDRKVQAYNYRICLTDAPENRLPIERPAGYDASRYELLARYIAARPETVLRGPVDKRLLLFSDLPNRKTDINDGAPFSTDFLGANWDYPEGDQQARERILREHLEYTQGLLYFLGHDQRVPESIRTAMLAWGYPKDEYVETDHWTPQLYIREARRMIGSYVMTQHDIQTNRTKRDSVGLGSYNADSHLVQRIVNEDGFVRNEGNPNDQAKGHKPYEIPYRCLTPKREQCDNLLATFCVSASHMGFASLRMEPVFMILSESAGAAAAQAVRDDKAVQAVDVERLQSQLRERGQILSLDSVHATK